MGRRGGGAPLPGALKSARSALPAQRQLIQAQGQPGGMKVEWALLTKGVAEANQSRKRAGGGWGRVSGLLWETGPGNAVEWPSLGTCAIAGSSERMAWVDLRLSGLQTTDPTS